jgi:hypothetical protein
MVIDGFFYGHVTIQVLRIEPKNKKFSTVQGRVLHKYFDEISR